MSEYVKEMTDKDFQKEVLESKHLTLVDFWAPWCGPCRMVGPALEAIADELGGKVIVAKMNVDDNPNTPTKYGVQSIPTLLLVRDGKVLDTKVGAMPRAQLKAWVENHIS